jgi:hypothetical protein
MHALMAATMDKAVEAIQEIQTNARTNNDTTRPRWPMIVLKSPKGWTGPKVVDGLQIEGTFRAHQVPLLVDGDHPDHVKLLEDWMKSYKAEELFDESGRLNAELAELAPKGDRRMGANPHANGGILLRDLQMPDFHQHAVTVTSPGAVEIEDTLVLGSFLRDVAKLNQDKRNFRVFGPDETVSNLLQAVFEVTNRQWDAEQYGNDEFLAPAGRVLDSMRVPLIVDMPGMKGNGRACTRMVQSLDLYRTLCELAGLDVPDGVEGSSLVPLLNDPRAAWEQPAYSIWSEDGKTIHGTAVRTEQWRYAEYGKDAANGAMLFDVHADPMELTNLADDPKHQATRAELSKLIAAYSYPA